MSLKLIVCKSSNNVIGINNSMPWNLPEDLNYFREQTKGCAIVMGKNTWMSLPKRPLPDRTNVIVSNRQSRGFLSDDEYDNMSIIHAYGIETPEDFTKKIASLEEKYKDVWIIGGASIYNLALDCLEFDEVHVTNILREITPENESDNVVYFPMDKVLAKYVPEEEHADIYTSLYMPDREKYTIIRYLPK